MRICMYRALRPTHPAMEPSATPGRLARQVNVPSDASKSSHLCSVAAVMLAGALFATSDLRQTIDFCGKCFLHEFAQALFAAWILQHVGDRRSAEQRDRIAMPVVIDDVEHLELFGNGRREFGTDQNLRPGAGSCSRRNADESMRDIERLAFLDLHRDAGRVLPRAELDQCLIAAQAGQRDARAIARAAQAATDIARMKIVLRTDIALGLRG